MLDSIGEGGIIENVATEELHFWRDVGPHFMSTWTFIGIHMFYFFTGNMALPFFLSILRVAYQVLVGSEKEISKRNVARKSEKMFMSDNRFLFPMATC